MNQNVEKERINFLDVVKFFAIYQVLWGHVTQYGLENTIANGTMHPFAYCNNAFHMPLFMTLSGIFAASSLKYSFFNLLNTKIRKLIVPAVIWTMITIGLIFFLGKNPFELYPVGNWMINYWFLECLFVCYLLFWGSMKLLKNDALSCVATLLLVFCCDRGSLLWLNSMLPFFWFGHFMKKTILDSGKVYKPLFASGLVFVFFLLNWSSDYTIYVNSNNFFSVKTMNVNIHDFAVMSYRFVTGASGALFFIFLWKAVSPYIQKTKIGDFMTTYGKETLAIYVIHTLVIMALTKVYIFPETTNIYLFDFVYAHGYNIMTILVCVVMIRLFKRTKITRILLLGSK